MEKYELPEEEYAKRSGKIDYALFYYLESRSLTLILFIYLFIFLLKKKKKKKDLKNAEL